MTAASRPPDDTPREPSVTEMLETVANWKPAPVAPDDTPPQEQIAWLVALGCSPPRWWTGRGDEWTDAVDGTTGNPACSAMRFARREDAERAIGWLLDKTLSRGCKAEEHLWCVQ